MLSRYTVAIICVSTVGVGGKGKLLSGKTAIPGISGMYTSQPYCLLLRRDCCNIFCD